AYQPFEVTVACGRSTVPKTWQLRTHLPATLGSCGSGTGGVAVSCVAASLTLLTSRWLKRRGPAPIFASLHRTSMGCTSSYRRATWIDRSSYMGLSSARGAHGARRVGRIGLMS